MSEESTPREPGALPAHWTGLRNPYFLAFVVGIVVVTASRMIFVSKPLPPPVGRPVPFFAAQEQHGQPYGTAQLQGRTWVGIPLTGEGRPVEALLELQRALERVHAPISLVAVWMGPTPGSPVDGAPQTLQAFGLAAGLESSRTKLVHLEPGTAEEFLTVAFSEHRSPVALQALLDEPRFLLVDGKGQSRGLYPITPEGVDEVYYRGRRVVETE